MPLTATYDPALVVLSVVIASLASYTALDLAGRVHATDGRARALWMAGGALAMGIGIWTMHFIGMLAFKLPIPVRYDLTYVALSIAVAVAASLLALWVVSRPDVRLPGLAAAATAMGVAIAGMHYIGMAAMRQAAHLHYMPGLWWLSIGIAIVASFAALVLARLFRADETRRGKLMRAAAAIVMGIAIAGMHYTGMAAAQFTAMGMADMGPDADGLSTVALAVGVTIAGLLIIGLALIAGMLDRLVRARTVEAELRLAMAAAEQTSRLKSEFLATMSHEIRTPMNGVLGMIGLALDSSLTVEQHAYLTTAKSSAEALLTILSDILDFSKIEAGKLEIESVPADLTGLLDEVTDLLAPRAHDKGLELVLHVRPGTPARVRTDPVRLRQVLINLLGNAIKFTEQGHILIRAEVEEGGDAAAPRVRFTVRDTGIGIAADRQPHLFEKFTQADSSTTRRFGGTGLGLAISRQLVELMGGQLALESVAGEGAAFSFAVPMPVDRTARVEPVPRGELEGVRVLIVDDIAVNRAVLEEYATAARMRGIVCENSDQALVALTQAVEEGDPFRIVLLDYLMPDVDGVTLAGRIRADRRMDTTALLLLTSATLGIDAERFAHAGFAGYFIKPVRREMLMHAIATVVGAQQAGRPLSGLLTSHSLYELAPDARRMPAASAQPTRIVGRALVVEDNPVNQLLAVKLLERAGWAVTTAWNGAEGVAAHGKERFDLILMACQMPVMDGFEATAAIRDFEGTACHTPIIAMTATAMRGDRERCIEAGMDDYVSKPIVVAELLETLGRWNPAQVASETQRS